MTTTVRDKINQCKEDPQKVLLLRMGFVKQHPYTIQNKDYIRNYEMIFETASKFKKPRSPTTNYNSCPDPVGDVQGTLIGG